MKRFTFLLAAGLFAQTPAPPPSSITASTSIVALAQQAANDANAVQCVLQPAQNHLDVTCKVVGTQILSATYVLAPSATSASNAPVVGVSFAGNGVTWSLFQPAAGQPLSWQVSANGVIKSGQF